MAPVNGVGIVSGKIYPSHIILLALVYLKDVRNKRLRVLTHGYSV